MSRPGRLISLLWPCRWWRSLVALTRGVRLHPSAQLLGSTRRIVFARGSVIGARVRIDVRDSGVLVAGPGIWLAADTEVDTDTAVRIGDGTTVQRRCTLNGSVRIGRGCLLGPNVFVSSGTHAFRDSPLLPIRQQDALRAARTGDLATQVRPVWIQDDCWLGVNVVVSPGVTIGKGSIVGANAAVTRDVEPYSVVGGVPARVIGQRLAWRPPMAIDMSVEGDVVYVLSGAPVLEEGRHVARAVSMEEPFSAVLAATVGRVRVRYRATASVQLTVDGATLRLDAGTGEFLLPTATSRFGGVLVTLCAVPGGLQSALHITGLQGLVEGAGA